MKLGYKENKNSTTVSSGGTVLGYIHFLKKSGAYKYAPKKSKTKDHSPLFYDLKNLKARLENEECLSDFTIRLVKYSLTKETENQPISLIEFRDLFFESRLYTELTLQANLTVGAQLSLFMLFSKESGGVGAVVSGLQKVGTPQMNWLFSEISARRDFDKDFQYPNLNYSMKPILAPHEFRKYQKVWPNRDFNTDPITFNEAEEVKDIIYPQYFGRCQRFSILDPEFNSIEEDLSLSTDKPIMIKAEDLKTTKGDYNKKDIEEKLKEEEIDLSGGETWTDIADNVISFNTFPKPKKEEEDQDED